MAIGKTSFSEADLRKKFSMRLVQHVIQGETSGANGQICPEIRSENEPWGSLKGLIFGEIERRLNSSHVAPAQQGMTQ